MARNNSKMGAKVQAELVEIRPDLRQYIETEIFPLYTENDDGHQLNHVFYVLRRALKFAKQFVNLDPEIIYAAVAYHDVCHHFDKDHHEALGAEKFWQDMKMQEFFDEKQRRLIRDVIADHRSSSEHVPINDYSKTLRSADCNTNVDSALRRTHAYTVRFYPELDEDGILRRGYEHIREKFSLENGYAKSYVDDPEYDHFKREIQVLIRDPGLFAQRYWAVNRKK